jgi:uncharacterized membrane protein
VPNAAYLHLMLNHFPIILNFAGVGVLVAAMLWKSDAVVRAALLLFIGAAVFGAATFLTGDEAADIVRKMDNVNPAAIAPHDDSAGITVTLVAIEGVAALAMWIARRGPREFPRWFPIALLAFSIVVSGQAAYTALLGGRIHHPETRMLSK